MRTVARLGRRFAEARREARAASKSVAGPAADQVTEVIGAAVGEAVRAAVIGAVAAAVRGATTTVARAPTLPDHGPWDDEYSAREESSGTDDPDLSARPRWPVTTRAVGS